MAYGVSLCADVSCVCGVCGGCGCVHDVCVVCWCAFSGWVCECMWDVYRLCVDVCVIPCVVFVVFVLYVVCGGCVWCVLCRRDVCGCVWFCGRLGV